MSSFPFAFFRTLLSRHNVDTRRRRRSRRSAWAIESLERRNLLAAVTVDFADLTLAAESYWNGPDPAGADEPDPFGGPLSVKVGKFTSGNVDFVNRHNQNYGNWSGFAYSNVTDNTTPGFGNQHSAFPGSGLGDANYGLAFGSGDVNTFDPTDVDDLSQLPHFTLPEDATVEEIYVSNTTYAALSMLEGDSFAKKFGGPSGDEPDWFKLTAYGVDAAGNVLPDSEHIYLADYTFADNSQDYVLDEWAKLDLPALATARRVFFNLTSSDVGEFGMNTPAYFAIENVAYSLPDPENRAPVLDTGALPALAAVDEDATNAAGTLVQSLIAGTVSDPDSGAQSGIAITFAGGTTRGAWEYTLDGANWLPLGTPNAAAARLLPADSLTRVRFVPSTNFYGQVNLYYRAWDQTQGVAGGTFDLSAAESAGGSTAFSTGLDFAAQQVIAVNDAPLLNNAFSPQFTALEEDPVDNPGTLVDSLIAGAVTEADSGALRGIAVTAAGGASAGRWEYTLDGSIWLALGSPTASAARLLPADGVTRVRFVPNANFHGNVNLYYRAWDQTAGAAGGTASISSPNSVGGTTAFSVAVETASLTVRPGNESPVLGGVSGSIGYTHGGSPIVIAVAASVSDADSANFEGGRLTLEITTGGNSNNHLQIFGALYFVDTNNNVVRRDATNGDKIVGTLNIGGGTGETKFEVTFTSAATPEYVRQLVRAIRFRTSGEASPGPRVIDFTLTDGDGGVATATKTVNVAAP